MWPVSTRWLSALAASRQITFRAEAWRGDTYLGPVNVSDGTLTVNAKNRVRRTLSLVVPEALFPSEADDLLAPYGTELRCWSGVNFGDQIEEIPVFRGLIQGVTSAKRYDGQLTVTANDLMGRVNDARFEQPRAAPTGTATTQAIATLVTEATGTPVVTAAGVSSALVPPGLSWDRDRGQACDDLAESIGADLWLDPVGTGHLAPPALLTDPPAWTLTDGVGGTICTDSRAVTRDGVYSVIVVVIERADGSTPIQVVVEDTDPGSPTYVGGAFGRVPRFYRSPLVADTAQALTAGRAMLTRSTGLTRTRTVECVPNPALEGGDRINITVAGQVEAHIVDSFTLPLGATGPMQISTRSARPDPGDIG